MFRELGRLQRHGSSGIRTAEYQQVNASDLNVHIREMGQGEHVALPAGLHFVWSSGDVRSGRQRSAEMVENDTRIREGPDEIDEFRELCVVQPGVEGEPPHRQLAEPVAEKRVLHKPRPRAGGIRGYLARRVPGGDLPDAGQQSVAGVGQFIQDLTDLVAQAQVGKPTMPPTVSPPRRLDSAAISATRRTSPSDARGAGWRVS